MKKLIFIAYCLFISGIGFSQNAAVTNAMLYHKDQELDKAKEEIDKAILDEKTSTQAKTWYYRGIIYTDLIKTTNPAFKTLSADPLKDAYQSFSKAQALDPSKGEYYKLSESKNNELWGEAINTGAAAYDNNKYEEAIKSFDLATKIKPADTTAYVYAIYSAEELKRTDLIAQYANGLLQNNYKSPYVYQKLIQAEPDNNKAIELSKKALTEFPGNLSLLLVRAQLHMKAGNTQGALDDFLVLGKASPGNKDYQVYIGSLYEKLDKDDKAIEYYNKTLALDPANVTANYNLGSIYYSRGKEVIDHVNSNTNFHAHHTTGKESAKEGNDYLLKSYDYAAASYKASKTPADINDSQDLMTKINTALKRKAPEGESLHK
jgi:tetratricopeptide (TPR) repeat protein